MVYYVAYVLSIGTKIDDLILSEFRGILQIWEPTAAK